MVRSLKFVFAAVFSALLGWSALAPAQAASMPVGAGLSIDRASAAPISEVRYHRVYRHRAYHHRVYHRPVYRHRAYYGRPVYRHRVHYGRPVYRRRYVSPVYYHPVRPAYRRCVIRPRTVWTPYGYVRRHVRVCRW